MIILLLEFSVDDCIRRDGEIPAQITNDETHVY
ncbi:Uncharacterised protein [Yersinia frederiksenii]|nr:Uncharacterised protein [Yersinia frederiksenii]